MCVYRHAWMYAHIYIDMCVRAYLCIYICVDQHIRSM